MGKEFIVVPCWKIGALVGPAGLGPMQGGLHNRFRHIQHEPEFQRRLPQRQIVIQGT